MRRSLTITALVCAAISLPIALRAADTPIRVEGTTNLAPLLSKAATDYSAAHGEANIQVHATSSGAGIASLKAHQIDVAMSDVAIDDPELADTRLGAVGFAFVVGKNTGISNLTRAQATQIFAGKVTNWKQIGGANQRIVIIGRDIGTGTRLILEEKVAKTLIKTRVEPNAAAVIKAVAAMPGAIGYVASGFIGTNTSMVIRYEGVAPTTAAIKNGSYRFSTIEHLYTIKSAPNNVGGFVTFVSHDKALLAANGVY